MFFVCRELKKITSDLPGHWLESLHPNIFFANLLIFSGVTIFWLEESTKCTYSAEYKNCQGLGLH